MRRAVARVGRRYQLRSIVLFGSHARGDARPGSDVDLCVSAPHLGCRREASLIGDLGEALQADVDVCVFERIGPSLGFTVAREGVPIYGPRDTFDRLRACAVLRWQDSYAYLKAAGAALDRLVG